MNDDDPITSGGEGGAPEVTARLLRGRLQTTAMDLPVSGSSMGSSIASGSVVTIVDAAVPRCGEVWASAYPDDRIVVHRVRHLDGDHVQMRGDGNPLDDPRTPRDWLIGRVVSANGPDGSSPRRFGPVDRLWAATRLRVRFLLRPLRTITRR